MAERDPYAELPDNDTAVADDDPYAGLPDAPKSRVASAVDTAVDIGDRAIRTGIQGLKQTGPLAPIIRGIDQQFNITKGMDERQQRNDQARAAESGTYAQGDVRAGALGAMRKQDIARDKEKAKTAPAYKNRREAVDDAVNMIDEGANEEKVYERFAAIGIKPEEIKAEADRRAPMGPPQTFEPQDPEAAVTGTIGQPEQGRIARGIDTGVTSAQRGYKQAQSMGNVIKSQLPGGSAEVAATRIAETNRTMPAYSDDVSAAIEKMAKSKTMGEAVAAAAESPGAFLAVLAESLVSSSPSLLAVPVGIVGGPGAAAATAGVTSYAMEFGSGIQDYLTQKGMNPRDPRDIYRALTDPTLMAEARDFAARRGVPVAAFDALSAGIAGKVLGPVVKKIEAGTLKGGKAIGAAGAATVAEAGIQGAAGATGERLAQYTSGQDYDPFSVLAEFGAEFISAPKEVATNILYAARNQQGEAPVGRGIDGQPPPDGAGPAPTIADLERIETDDGPAFRTPSGAIVSESQWNDAPPDRQAMWMQPAEGEQAPTVSRETDQAAAIAADVQLHRNESVRLEAEAERLRTEGQITQAETLRIRALSLAELADKIEAANGISEQSLTPGIKVEEIRGARAPLEPTERMQELERLADVTQDPTVKKDLLQKLKAERQAQEQGLQNEATADAYDRAALETEDKALAAELKKKATALRKTEKPSTRGIQVREEPVEGAEGKSAGEVERRKDSATRKKYEEMSPEELRQELLTSPVTKLPNRRAYDEASKRAVTTSVDVDSLKWVNDNMGHPAGDEMLRMVGEAIKESGADGFHLSGDEFVIQSDTPEQAEKAMRQIRKTLAKATVSHTLPDGSVITKKGIDLSHGSGRSVNEAESKLRQSKAERARRGVRPERGAEPKGVDRKAPGAGQEARGAGVGQLGGVSNGPGRSDAPTEINTTPLWQKRSGLTLADAPSAAKIRTALAADQAAVMRAAERHPNDEAAFLRTVQEIIDASTQEKPRADAGRGRADDVAAAGPAVRRAEAGERQPNGQETRSAREETARDVQQDGQPGEPGADLAARSRRQQPRAERDQATGRVISEPRKVGDGFAYRILQDGKIVGHISGFERDGSFHMYKTELSDDAAKGTGLYRRAVQAVADRYPNGLFVHEWEASAALRASLAKMPTRSIVDDRIVIAPTQATGDLASRSRREEMSWEDVELGERGDVFVAGEFMLDPVRELEVGTGFGGELMLGHAAHVAPGNRVVRYQIAGRDGKALGRVDLQLDPQGNVVALHDISVQNRGQGVGRQVVGSLLANFDTLQILDIVPTARSFWEKLGTGYIDEYGNATLDWSSFARATARQPGRVSPESGRGSAQRPAVQGSPQARQGQASQDLAALWYSPLQRAIEGITTKQASPQQWLNTITALQSKGVKADEIEFSGVKEWLATRDDGKVSRDDLLAFLRENGVRVDERFFGANIKEMAKQRRDYIITTYEKEQLDRLARDELSEDEADQQIADFANALNKQDTEEGMLDVMTSETGWTRDEAAEIFSDADESAMSLSDSPQYAQYVLPGGRNYREILLTLPSTGKAEQTKEQLLKALGDPELITDPLVASREAAYDDLEPGRTVFLYRMAGGSNVYLIKMPDGKYYVPTPNGDHTFTRQVEAELFLARWAAEEFDLGLGQEDQFMSSHWGVPNIIAHVRFDERTDADGKKVLFIQEIQSDWAQIGKRRGFRKVWKLPDNYEVVRDPERFADYMIPNAWFVVDENGDVVGDGPTREAAIQSYRDLDAGQGTPAGSLGETGVPAAPFVQKTEAWAGLALKRVIRYAAENGFDRVAWTTGDQQNDRYKLSTQVESIDYHKNEEGTYGLWAQPKGSSTVPVMPQRTLALGIPADKLEDYVGKELAQRIINGDGRRDSYKGRTRLAGLDLEVGGKGMRAFYDKIVPNVAKDVLKKLGGGTVGSVLIDAPRKTQAARYLRDGDAFRVFNDDGEMLGLYPTEQQAQQAIALTKRENTQQPGFDITPTMRELAAQGMPLFSRRQPRLGMGEQLASVRAALDDAFGKPLIDGLIRAGILRLEYSWQNKRALARDPSVRALNSEGDERGPGASLFLDRIRAADAPALLMHEVGEHYGLPRMLGHDGYQKVLDGIRRAYMKNDAETVAAWDLVKRDYTNEDGTMMVPEGSDNFIREVAAAMVEKGVERGWIREMLDAIRSWLTRTFGVDVDKVDGNLLRGLATSALRQSAAGMLPRTSQFTADRAGSAAIDPTTKAFKRWFGKSKVVDEDGEPLMVYHGTTGDFDTFDRSRSNPESDFGAGFYFSNTPDDVANNYAGEGPDLTAKLQMEAERVADEMNDEGGISSWRYDDPEVVVRARQRLGVQHGGASMPVYLKMENPVVVGNGRGGKDTFLDYDDGWNPETEEYDPEPTASPLQDFIEALRDVAGNYQDGEVDTAIGAILEEASGDGIHASRLIQILKDTEEFNYYADDEGKLVRSEIWRQAFERAGFDGIIDNTVDVKFGSQKRIGASMRGMNPDTVHYIAFKPTQIKSAIGNRGTYDPKNPSILASRSMSLEADRISPRAPTAVKRTEDPLTQELQPDLQTMMRNREVFLHNLKLLTDSPDIRVDTRATPEQQAEQVIAHFQRNLEWLFDRYRDHADRAKLWYVGGNKISHSFANRFGIEPRQAAGVIAALSPQKDWFQNVSLAERIMSAVYEHPDSAWSPAMDNVLATRDWGKGISQGDRDRISGKTLREVWGNGTAPELLSAAHWIRAWDEATNPQMARVITPEGGFSSDWDVGNTGKPIALRAQGFSAMAKSLRILADGSRESISAVIGANHKVRSFYNNIIAPYSTSGDVTIDTHAVAAAHLLPLGSSSDLVAQTFGGGNVGQPASKSSDLTGLMGNYAFYAEAYRRAAAAKGVLPREMQSVTWEAVRGLFRPEQKVALKRSVATIWERYGRGEIDENQAREETLGVAEGVADPKWAGSPAGRDEGTQDSSYAAQLPQAVAPRGGAVEDSVGDDGRGAGGTEDLAAKSRALPQPPSNSSNLDEETAAQTLQRKFFDRFNRVRQLQRERRPGIADDKNVVQADTLYYGRAQYEGEELERKFIEPLGEALKEAKKLGLTVRDADDYLMARHAPERNRVIAMRNPNMPDGGSGLTNRQAAQMLAKYDPKKTAALDKIAQIVYRMNEDRLLRQETSGLISQQMATALRSQYKNYVPLKTLDEENAVMGVGRGYELRNSGIELAFGRQSKAGSPIASSIMDAARAVVMSEKAKVDRVIWALANDPDVIDVMTPVDDANAAQHFSRQRLNPTTGQIETVSDSNWRSREDVVKLRVDGEEKYVWVRDDILRDQLRKVASLADPGPVLRGLGRVTSTIGRLLTEFNPAFTLPNAVRDAIGGVIKSNGIERVNPLRVAAGIPVAWKAIVDFKRDANTPGGRMYRDFQQDGAKTGAYGITDVGDTMHRLERLGAELGYAGKERGITTKLMHGLNDLAKFVGHANEVVEYATRLSLYSEARRVGYSRKQAAVWAKELTVNFNRSGEYGRTMNSIFVFANAALQGLYGAIMFGKSNKVKAALLGLVVLGAVTQAFNEAFGGDDEETDEKNINTISDHTLDNNATVLIPGSANGIKIPLPPEFSFLYAMGRRAYRAMSQGNYGKEAAGIVGATLGSTLPLRAPDASSTPLSVMKALTPTAVSPFMDIAVNEDFRGAPIVPNQREKDAPQPWPVLARSQTSDVSKAIASFVNTATGGDTVEPGAAQKAFGPFVSPEAMDHVVGFYTGGLGQFALQSKNLARAVGGDEKAVEINRIPIANRFVFTQPIGYVGRRYRELAPDFQYAMARQRDGSAEKIKDEVMAALPTYRGAERQLTPLFKQLRAAGEEGDKVREEELRAQIRAVQSTVLKAYNEARPAR